MPPFARFLVLVPWWWRALKLGEGIEPGEYLRSSKIEQSDENV